MFFLVILMIMFTACSNDDLEIQIDPLNSGFRDNPLGVAYIVSDSMVLMATIRQGSTSIPSSPGGSINIKKVEYSQVSAKVANQAFKAGITKEGMDFSMPYREWTTAEGDEVKKSDCLPNAIYIEKDDKIKRVSKLIINHKGGIRYVVIGNFPWGILYEKRLSPLENYDNSEDSKVAGKIFIY